jgi:hypothetical protein
MYGISGQLHIMSCVPLPNYHATPHYSDHAVSNDAIKQGDRQVNPANTSKVLLFRSVIGQWC